MAGEIARAIDRICNDLSLPRGGPYTQDWAIQVGTPYRTAEYLEKYAQAYMKADYAAEEKKLLMQLMLLTVNDLLECRDPAWPPCWTVVRRLLRANWSLHGQETEGWLSAGYTLEDAYPLTPFMRELEIEATGPK